MHYFEGFNLSVANAERVRKVKLPKKRLLKKPRKRKPKGSTAFDGVKEARPKRNARKQVVKFCPKCGSTDIFWASGLPQLWSIWECRNCGYRGALILEDGKLAEKLRGDYARKIFKH